jgi:hypothetical protein
MLMRPCLTPEQMRIDWKGNLLSFLEGIFEKDFNEAKRLPLFGYNSFFQGELAKISELKEKQRKVNMLKLKLGSIYESIFSSFIKN